MPPVTAERSPPELADDRRGFAGDRRLVDRGHAHDHLAIRRNHVAGFDENNVTDLEAGARHQPIILQIAGAGEKLGLSLGALPAQRVGLRLAAALGHRFGEIGEQHGEPQPQDDLELERNMAAAGHEIADENDRRQRRNDLEHEHDGILHERARIELDEGGADGRHDDLRIEQRRDGHALAQG